MELRSKLSQAKTLAQEQQQAAQELLRPMAPIAWIDSDRSGSLDGLKHLSAHCILERTHLEIERAHHDKGPLLKDPLIQLLELQICGFGTFTNI